MPIPVRPKPFLPPGCPGGMYAGLARLSAGCPPDRGRLHTCYSPVRRSPAEKASFLPAAPRLACVKPAASVHPEPGSNSPLLVSCFQNSSNCLLPVQDSFFHCWNLDGTYLFVPVLFKQLSLLCLVAKFQSSRRFLRRILDCFFKPCLSGSVPESDCKVIAKIRAVQIFLPRFLKIPCDIHLSY